MIKKPKRITVSKAKAKAWKVFSEYIRKSALTKLGIQCFTCERWLQYRQAQAGHFQPGRFPIFLFDERQVKPQCFRCNINLKGNWPRYYENMVRDYGKEEVEKMIAQRNNFKQWKVQELIEIERHYKSLLKMEEKNAEWSI